MNTVQIRRYILEMSYRGQAGHIPSAFSIVEILAALYEYVLQPDDRFILSKGHGCLALYAVLVDQGLIQQRELSLFAQPGGWLGGHPAAHIPGIEFATGSLGHGLGAGIGMTLGKRIVKEPGRVFVLVGDGECQEGSTWEAVDIAAELNLPIWCIVDDNGTHGALQLRFEAHGWENYYCNGHDIDKVASILCCEISRPSALIAATVKGKGSKILTASPAEWHHRAPTEAELAVLLMEVGA